MGKTTAKKDRYSGQDVFLIRTRPKSSQAKDQINQATVGNSFAKGAAAAVYHLAQGGRKGTIAKLYHDQYRTDPTIAADTKLLALVVRYDELAAKLPFVMWPDELVVDRANVSQATLRDALLGFTMQKLPAGTISLYTLLKQKAYRRRFQSGDTTRLAAKIADCIARLHAAGIVFCDLNPKNIHVSKDLSEVYFLDADGYQLALNGKTIPSRGVTEGYASPTAIANHATNPTALRSSADDTFVLAILAFQLLVDRAHPFATGPQYAEHPAASDNDNIVARRFAFADRARYQPDAEAADLFARLVTPLKAAFHLTFTSQQPLTAADWAKILTIHAQAPLAATPTPEPTAADLQALSPAPRTQTAPLQSTAQRRAPSQPLKYAAMTGCIFVAGMGIGALSGLQFWQTSTRTPLPAIAVAMGDAHHIERMLTELPDNFADAVSTVEARRISADKP